ncbi:selenocysteine-specific elongation factor [Geobacter sp. OR-1]|uniref:selenocysteine-specific translation elongation factor n=1 Tax=Geobacter sp. OR-1 TaxID=1266765 RepID=UPI0005427748|nr:selenocysteine-specific translation elongation factor [Geobacter sp. OR-1]GAM11156.1 selenocysteine-specific elongation factor [Geobacter sp. OR-1]
MKHLILGTAGHIDHGKSSLIKALTGIDTDRLPEEKARGITIELGFAHLEIPGRCHFGIVDVPGHERFVRTMVAGVGGIDMVMLVIAADEGVMPQTREHLDICQLLGVKNGIVALTKSDLVEKEWLALVREEVKEFLSGSFLENAPIIPVSARTGAGLEDLVAELGRLAVVTDQKRADGPFRLPVDRVITVPGFGTVVTGTMLSGKIATNDEVEILPRGLHARVRGVQTHGAGRDQGSAGERLALNLQGVGHDEVRRGDVVVPRGAFRTTGLVDVRLELLKSAPRKLKHRARLRFHAATYEIAASVVLFNRSQLEPGESDFAQLRLSQPVVLQNGDTFVLRSSSPAITVGGGRILDPFPPPRRRRTGEAVQLLEAVAAVDEAATVSGMVASNVLSGISFSDLTQRTGYAPKRLESVLTPLLASGDIIQVCREPKIYLSRTGFSSLCQVLAEELAAFFSQNPLKDAMSKEELKSRFPARSDQRFFSYCISALEKSGTLVIDRELVKPLQRQDRVAAAQQDMEQRIESKLASHGSEPPSIKELAVFFDLPEKSALELLNRLARSGRAVKVKSDLFYPPAPLAAIRDKVVALLEQQSEMSPADFREVTGLSRKYMIPLLEYFDEQKLTIRSGDKRRLRRSSI